MPLRAAKIALIRNALTRYRFDVDDFSISIESVETREVCSIVYRFLPEYFCKITFDKDHDIILLDMCPGDLLDREQTACEAKLLYNSIHSWVDNLREELNALPHVREMMQIEEQLKVLEKNFENIDDVYFTREEAQDLVDRLQNLEEWFNLSKENTEESTKSVVNDIAELRQQIVVLRKPGWFLSFFSKASKWGSTHPAIISDIAKGMAQFLPDGAREITENVLSAASTLPSLVGDPPQIEDEPANTNDDDP